MAAISFLKGPSNFFVGRTSYSLGPEPCYYCQNLCNEIRVEDGKHFVCMDCGNGIRPLQLDGNVHANEIIINCLKSQRNRPIECLRRNETVLFKGRSDFYEADTIEELSQHQVFFVGYYHIQGYYIVESQNVDYIVRNFDIERLNLENLAKLEWLSEHDKCAALRLPFFAKRQGIECVFHDFLSGTQQNSLYLILALLRNKQKYLLLRTDEDALFLSSFSDIYDDTSECVNKLLFRCDIESTIPNIDGFFGEKFEILIEELCEANLLEKALEVEFELAERSLEEVKSVATLSNCNDAEVCNFLHYLTVIASDNPKNK